MAMNPSDMMKIAGSYRQFAAAHPKFVSFFSTVLGRGIEEGSVIEITVTGPDGTPITGNMRVTAEDLELFRSLREMGR